MLKTLLLAGTAITIGAGMAGSAAAQISNDVIRIGVLNDRSGIYADLSGEGSAVAARMAVEEFGGTVAGAPIEVIVGDHQNKADIAANTAREWVDTGNVDVIADVPNSAAALAVQEITRDRKRIFLMSGPGTTDLTGKACSPYGFHWTYDNYAMAAGTGRALYEQGNAKWFFITADYAFGHSLENETSKMVTSLGGEVVGTVRHPLGTADFSSFLLQAQGSGADVIGLANAGSDTTNSIKQASEFGITQAGQNLAGLLLFISDIHALGLEAAQDLMLTTGFYWDRTDETREWAAAFESRHGSKPTMVHAGVYSAVRHYLRAVQEAGTDDPDAVAAKMRELPVSDMFANDGKVLPNGRMVHEMYLARVKKPSESTGPWDYYEIVSTMPADQAFLDPKESGCSLVN
jgi:branched-chain amino acid transport system substrate-binding protein